MCRFMKRKAQIACRPLLGVKEMLLAMADVLASHPYIATQLPSCHCSSRGCGLTPCTNLEVRGVPRRAVLAEGGSGGRPRRALEGAVGEAPSTGLPRGGVPGRLRRGMASASAGRPRGVPPPCCCWCCCTLKDDSAGLKPNRRAGTWGGGVGAGGPSGLGRAGSTGWEACCRRQAGERVSQPCVQGPQQVV